MAVLGHHTCVNLRDLCGSLMDCVMPLSLCFNQNVSQGFSSLQYDMSGGSVKISSLVVVDSV